MSERYEPADLDDVLNPGDHLTSDGAVGKDPHLSGPREDESEVDPMGGEPEE